MENAYFFQRLALRRNKSFLKFFGLLAVMLFAGSSVAWGQISITTGGTPYSQDFNTLATSGTNNTWTDNITILGWYSNRTVIIASDGSSTTGGLFSYGSGVLTERALGGLSSGSVTPVFGAKLVNNTGSIISSFAVAFRGEQWRQTANAHILVFEYSTDATSLATGTWTPVTALNFTALKTGTAGVLNGNVSGNFTNLSSTINVSVANGNTIWFKWTKSGSTSPGLAIDDFSVTATTSLISPTLTAASSPTVDAAFDVTFTEDASWRGAITEITVGGTTLAASAYDKTAAGKITFTPSASALLQSAGTKAIVVKATGYTDATVSQAIGAGVAAALTLKTQPAAPATNGAALSTQPEVWVKDQYENITTGTVVASKGDAGAWTLGGTTSVAAVSGISTFTNLTATSAAAVTGAKLTFTLSGLTVSSATFDIAAPPAQIDWTNLQWPGTGTVKLGQAYDVYARVYEPGVTDAVGQGAGVQVWIGYSTSATNPNTWTNWVAATYYGDDGANNDEYKANLGAVMTAAGTYYYATRVQLGTALYVYGGFNGGFWDGTTNVSGVLTVNPAETLDWVNLQAPASGNITTAQTLDVYAQVYESGLTEAGGQGAGVSAWIGYSTSNTNPNTWTNWVPASFNVQSGNNDEYKAILSGLTAGTYYYASRFKYGLADYQYGGLTGAWVADQSGVLTVTTAEPADHVTNFAAATTAPTHSSIKLDWTDAAGASHYLIKGSAVSYEDITTPVDLSSEVDGTLVKNVAAGAGTYTFEGLTGETAYFFKIFPYNGTGAAVNFKTDGTVPQASATTAKTPTLLLVEDFDYANGTVLTTTVTADPTTGWAAHGNNGTNNLTASTTLITYPGYLSSGIGNETLLSSAGGQDVNRVFTEQVSGTVYASCLVNVTSASTAGDYFLHFGPTTMGTTYRGRVFVKRDANSKIAFGIQHTGGNNNTNINYTPFSYSLNTTYLVVLKYSIVSGVDNDVVAIYINPVLNASEPITNWLINTDTPTDPANIGSIGLRQASPSTAPNVKLDGVRVSTKWSDIVGDLPTFTGTGEWTETARWNTGTVPGITAQVVVDGAATINSDVEVAGLTINAGKSLTVNAAKQLTISGTATNNGTITIQSDENGTGTIVGNVSGAATVQQYLPGDGRQWWYLSSPVTGAKSTLFGSDKVGKYNEATTSYTSPFSTETNLVAGTGYVVKRAVTTAGTYTFEGTLNNGDYTLTPTRTGVTAGKRGFNLVGNPYPSYLDWDAAYADASRVNISNAIWYRTYSDGQMTFHTYADEDGVPATVSGIIPPAQAFWIRVNADGSNGSITFKNTHRSHAGATANPLKAPKANERQRIRLQVSNGVRTDEALIVAKSYASNGIDSYDIEKMSNDNVEIPEIYTLLNNQDMVINSFSSFVAGQEITLGMRPGKAGDFTINATQLENIPSDIKVILKDKFTGAETELSENASYSFNADGNETNQRFSLLFRAPGSVTGIDNAGNNTLLVYAQQSEIVVNSEELKGSNITVYTATGQSVLKTVATGNREVLNGNFTPGVYFVKVNNTVKKVSVK